MNQWIDLTLKLNENTLPFPGDEHLKITWDKRLDKDGYNLSKVASSMHLGTHIDYKLHVLNEKDDISFDQWIGKANVIYVTPREGVVRTKDIIQSYEYIDHKENMLLISLNHETYINTKRYFEYPKFEPSIMDFLLKHDIRLLGSDLPSYEYLTGDMLDMHKDCLSNDIYLLENVVCLNQLSSHIELMVMPLPIEGIEASWVRVLARKI